MTFFLKGVDFRNPNLTRNLRLWGQYICWCIQAKINPYHWVYPRKIRMVLWKFNRDVVYMPGFRVLQWVHSVFRRGTGGRSHRCEFTDPESGALYGANEGAFMDKMFEKFLENID